MHERGSEGSQTRETLPCPESCRAGQKVLHLRALRVYARSFSRLNSYLKWRAGAAKLTAVIVNNEASRVKYSGICGSDSVIYIDLIAGGALPSAWDHCARVGGVILVCLRAPRVQIVTGEKPSVDAGTAAACGAPVLYPPVPANGHRWISKDRASTGLLLPVG